MFKKIGRALKKIVTGAASVVGIGTGVTLGAGGAVSGNVLVDVALVVGCVVLIIVNGKDGVPEWFRNMKSSKSDDA